jgi:lipopolysaccharide cholinephosphotransferase
MNNLKEAQNIMLDILIEVDRVCNKYNIKYWLSSGTLLGAVRHKCFIPWDDDLDICMLKEDYDRFLEIAPKELPKDMFLQTRKTDKFFPYDSAKIRSNRGKIIETHEINKEVKYNQGIFIDIFPMMLVKKSIIFRLFQKVYFLLVKVFSYKYLNIELLRVYLVNFFYKFHNKNNNILINSAALPDSNIYINKKYIFPLKRLSFCGKSFFVPNDYERYLKMIYGKSYMKLPPINKRHTHAYKIEIY